MKLSPATKGFLLLGAAIVLASLVNILAPELFPAVFGGVRHDILKALYRPFFHIGRLPVTTVFLVEAFVFLGVLGVLSRLSRRFARERILSLTSLDVGQQYAFSQITSYAVFLIGLLVGLQWAGLDLSSLVILGGAVGIGVGFGLQNIANNFVSGLVLLVERPIRVGDRVDVGGTNGDVVRIGARSTWVRTNENVVIIIPNAEFINNRVTNWTVVDRQVRFAVPLGVSYGSDPEKVREILLAVGRAHPDVLADPPPEVLFARFGESSLDFELRVWTAARVQTPRVLASELYFSIFRAFRENGIEIPFPQRDIHVRSVSAPFRIEERE